MGGCTAFHGRFAFVCMEKEPSGKTPKWKFSGVFGESVVVFVETF